MWELEEVSFTDAELFWFLSSQQHYWSFSFAYNNLFITPCDTLKDTLAKSKIWELLAWLHTASIFVWTVWQEIHPQSQEIVYCLG